MQRLFSQIVCTLVCALVFAGCDLVGQLKDGMAKSQAASQQISKAVGVTPSLGFNYNNGKLVNVTVTFPSTPSKPTKEVEEIVRKAVAEHFQTEPEKITISYTLPKNET